MKRHLVWIGEVFVWILILSIISISLILFRFNQKQTSYQIFLPDVDGLVSGSPVKIMGIQVGYVNQLDIVGEDVYIKFIITEQNVKIPPGAIATVEFSGLGGSKSLEIYPPEKTNDLKTDKYIIAQSPKRIHDSLGLLNDMFDKIVSITFDVSHFMKEMGLKNKKDYNKTREIDTSHNSIFYFLNNTNHWLDNANQKNNKFYYPKTNKNELNTEEVDYGEIKNQQ